MKKTLLIFIVIIIIFAIGYILPLPTKINKTLSGIQWKSGDLNYYEQVDIKISGTYKKYLLKDNVFVGHITITNNELTYLSKATLKEIKIKKSDIGDYGYIIYYNSVENKYIDAGKICLSGFFEKVVIHLTDSIKGKLTDYYISAPAIDRKSAFAIAVEFKLIKN